MDWEAEGRNRPIGLLDEIAAGRWVNPYTPTVAELADAPHLAHWRIERTDDGREYLAGVCTGHPRLGRRAQHITTRFLVERGDGWARTEGRVYRLGAPAPDATLDEEPAATPGI